MVFSSIKAFTAAVLGGIGSLPGAMLGGLLIGLIETMWSGYVSIEYKDVAAFGTYSSSYILSYGFLGKPDIESLMNKSDIIKSFIVFSQD